MNAGIYYGHVVAACYNERASGAVSIDVKVKLEEGGQEDIGSIWVVQKDGTRNEKGYQNVSRIFGLRPDWDWDDFPPDNPTLHSGQRVQLKYVDEEYNGNTVARLKYVNPCRDIVPSRMPPKAKLRPDAGKPAAPVTVEGVEDPF